MILTTTHMMRTRSPGQCPRSLGKLRALGCLPVGERLQEHKDPTKPGDSRTGYEALKGPLMDPYWGPNMEL